MSHDVKELLARNSRDILNLSNCNWNQFQNHLVHKRIFKHLAQLETQKIQYFSSLNQQSELHQ